MQSIAGAALAGCLITALAVGDAHAILGGVEVPADDPGGRASVIVTTAHTACSGVVYGDSFILTAAHCLLDRDFKPTITPQDLTITYGRSLKAPDAVTRAVSALVMHENYAKQVDDATFGKGPLPFDDYLINEEDIALLRIAGTHPPGALSAALPQIDNEYVVCCLARPRSWPLVWMDIYGFGAAPKGEVLHKVRTSTPAPDMVRPGRQPNPNQPYLPRQLAILSDDPPDAPLPPDARGTCHGDSGGPAFFVATTRSHAVPDTPLKLIDGKPLAVGLVSHTSGAHETDPDKPDAAAAAMAGCDDDTYLVRLDYYRDWVLSRVGQLR
jgi:Trypsin